jgi:AraC-like DNA-binding protein
MSHKSDRQRLEYSGTSLSVPGVRSLGHYRYLTAQPALPPHIHADTMEISLLVRGQQTYRVYDDKYTVESGEVFITYPEERHDTCGEPEEKGECYWLQLHLLEPDNFLGLSTRSAVALQSSLNALPMRHFRISPAAQSDLEQCFIFLQQTRTPQVQLFIEHHLRNYVMHVLRAASAAPVLATSAGIQKCIDYIQQSGQADIALEELAALVGLSLPQFKCRFRREAGLPPAEFMIRHKVQQACQLLEQKRMPVTDLAFLLGFSSSQYFSTVFKRYTGCTPSGYLEMKLREENVPETSVRTF